MSRSGMRKMSISAKPTKQRRELYRAPSHLQHKLLGVNLSPELRSRYGRRTVPIRSGDTVKIVRGDFEGIEGKVSEVDKKRQRIFIEGVTREKVSGTPTKVSVHASKVQIIDLKLDDKWRADRLKEIEKEPVKGKEAK
jgi:large subunit ribosomal protein L24